ncbi:RNA polymerase sigma factor [Mucilaginibacter sp. HMF5004]|uniref:RNA polymerase sigma factor n=1 Tax=Mucilaginibacter rivuli TaxID=2857527 RepID=UPI001C5DDFDA|nr:RNA polymerase sigma factor [Mucilaginibacter rivuli]MBW4888677.1 RNA polymerase sigma factor [Mucilaginibacter rivuli]
MLTDNAIMLKVKEGDLDRMGLLFERYHRQLYGFLFHMTYKKELAEDMVQHTFYKMLKYRNSFTGTGEFVHWMYTVARNVLKDEYKKMKRAQLHDDVDNISDILPGGVHTGDMYDKKEAARGLHKAMEKLSDEQREILTMSRFQELKHQEIAEILNMTEGAVKVRVHRAMQELKSIYTKMES